MKNVFTFFRNELFPMQTECFSELRFVKGLKLNSKSCSFFEKS